MRVAGTQGLESPVDTLQQFDLSLTSIDTAFQIADQKLTALSAVEQVQRRLWRHPAGDALRRTCLRQWESEMLGPLLKDL